MPRGRPIGSPIRKRLIEILFVLKQSHGYEICKIYDALFPACTKEVIYYHLRKGVELDEFKVQEIKIEKGDYSWGPETRKIIYALGIKANPLGDPQVKKFIDAYRKN